MIDIPTAVTERESLTLLRYAEGGEVLEVGSLLGYSTVRMARVARHVTSVDPHEDYPVDNPRPTLETFMHNLRRHGVRHKVSVVVETHDKVFPRLAPAQFDLIFIDATGEEYLTFAIMVGARRLLAPHGVLCVHDCGHPDWPGALAAVEHYRDIAADLGSVTFVDRLATLTFRND